jgi:hypothetical protein
MSRPLDELRAISAAWGTLTRDASPTQNDLAIAVYHTMVDPSGMRGVWENLDVEERAFTSWLLNQRNMLALVDDLPGLLDRTPDEVAPLLERVRRIGLVDVDEVMVRGSRVVSSGDNLYAWAARNQPEATPRRVVSIATEAAKVLRDIIEESKRPPPFEEDFPSLLGNLEQVEVQRIASTWKLPDAARYYKSELIGVMSEFLATGQGKQLLLSTVSPSSQSLFTYLEEEGGKATAGSVKKHFSWSEREFRAATLGLIQRALLWDVMEGERRFLFVPRDLISGGKQSGPVKIAPYMQPKLDAPSPYTVITKLPYELAWDLLTLLAEASEGELQLTLQDTRITKRVAKKINESFLHPEDMKAGSEYIDMVVHLAQSLGLLSETHGEQPSLTLTSKVDDWVRHNFDSQRRRLYGMWQEDRKWSEPATYGTIYWWNSDLTGARKRLVKQLLELPVNKWISVEGFLRQIHITEPFLIWDQEELVKRYGLRALQGFRNHWFEIEGRIIADMLRTMLNWLGAVDIGKDKQKRFVAFRITEEGRSLLDPEYPWQEQSGTLPRPLLVQPNFEVLVLHPDSRVLWTLLRLSKLVRHDRVSAYVINKESILRAVESGLSPETITRFLHDNTGKDLPQNVAQSVSDWARLIKYTGVHRVTLIEVEDPSILDEMAASRKTKKYIARRLSPTVAVARLPEVGDSARDDPWQRLMKELRSAGYVPRFESELMESGTVIVAGNGKSTDHEPPHTNGRTAATSATEPKKRRTTVGRPAKTEAAR